MHVDCGKCEFCLQKKRNAWTFRLMNEEKESENSIFVTLTYCDEFMPYGKNTPSLHVTDVQKFFKRLRKKNDKKIRYFLAGEYGEQTNRPHYHAIIFNCDPDTVATSWSLYSRADKEYIPIGNVDIKPVNQARMHYVSKYMVNNKEDDGEDRQKPFNIMSRKPGIGYGYIKKAKAYHRNAMSNYVILEGGQKMALPKYYKDKLFTGNEKFKLYEQFLKTQYEKDKERIEKLGYDKKTFLDVMQIKTRINRINKFSKSKNLK